MALLIPSGRCGLMVQSGALKKRVKLGEGFVIRPL